MATKRTIGKNIKKLLVRPVPENTVLYQLLLLVARRVAARLRETKSEGNPDGRHNASSSSRKRL